MKVSERTETDVVVMQYILDTVCRVTDNKQSVIMSKCRIWQIVYARYLLFAVAVKLHIKSSVVIDYLGKKRQMIYSYRTAVRNLTDTDIQFRVDCNKVYECVIDHFNYDRD